jgi:OOP family OmpA-OmpF porin
MMGGGLIAAAENAAPVAAPQTKQVIFPLDIKFDTNKAEIKSGEHNDAEFKKLSQELNNYPYAKVQIQGYADATGPELFNQKRSEKRAEAVRQRFVSSYGIASGRIESVGFGDTKPVANDATVAGRTENRRVIATIFRLEPGKIEPNGTHL